MKVTPDTKISEIIKANPASIDAIVAIAKPFRRLKNPILRRVMASRITVAEAVLMGGCSFSDFQLALSPLGFVCEEKKGATAPTATHTAEWLSPEVRQAAILLDVRPTIASGKDPLSDIMAHFKKTETGQALCVINSFIPFPLIKLLEGKGAISSSEEPESGVYHTWFLKEQPDSTPSRGQSSRITMHNEETFGQTKEKFAHYVFKEIDVRDLPMPQPMETILEALPQLSDNEVLYVHHKRVPVYLLDELAQEAYQVHVYQISEGNVKLLIVKGDS